MAELADTSAEFERKVYRKVTGRIIPYLFLCYILAYLDRVNVGFGKLQMQQDLGISDGVYGIGAGVFFFGYFLFEVPSNVMLQKIGARRWIGPIMIAWGLISSATMFVQGASSFFALRFLLGVVESGFFPGVILYLTFWYPQEYRAKVVAGFMSAIALSGVIGGPVSGWILASMPGVMGMRGWQWLYLLEGIPSVVVGFVTLWFLDDTPAKARWLSAEERALLVGRLERDEAVKKSRGAGAHKWSDAFRDWRIWAFAFVYFGTVMVLYGLSFWLPQILKDMGAKGAWNIGLLSAIPWAVGAVGMILLGYHSDKTGERRWHFAFAACLAGVAFFLSGIPGIHPFFCVAALSIAAAGALAAQATFWTMPTAILSGTASAAGIAWINSIANLGAFVSPYVVGLIRDRTHNMMLALMVLAVACIASGVAVLFVVKKTVTAPAAPVVR